MASSSPVIASASASASASSSPALLSPTSTAPPSLSLTNNSSQDGERDTNGKLIPVNRLAQSIMPQFTSKPHATTKPRSSSSADKYSPMTPRGAAAAAAAIAAHTPVTPSSNPNSARSNHSAAAAKPPTSPNPAPAPKDATSTPATPKSIPATTPTPTPAAALAPALTPAAVKETPREASKEAPKEAVAPPSDIKLEDIPEHPLQREWTLWYDADKKTTTAESYGSTIKPLFTFGTVEQFWSLYNSLYQPSMLAQRNSYFLFVKGIKPEWEDPANSQGGRWQIEYGPREDDQLNLDWLHTLLALIGDSFTDSHEICGAVMNLRPKKNRIQIWTRAVAPRNQQERVGIEWKKYVDSKSPLEFQLHQSNTRKPSMTV